jgi:diguanylate cyclase (GGDEF)-like protein
LANPVPSTSTPSVLIVDDDPLMLRLLGQMLSAHVDVSIATSGAAALRAMRARTPDLVLLDAEMPEMSGTEICRAIKRDRILAPVPVIFVTSQHDPTFEATCFELGAVDFIHKPVQAPVLIARLEMQFRLKQQAERLQLLATVDAVTECANRRVFDEKLQEEWSRTRRNGLPLSLLLIDIDHFKLFNDHYGHPAGDACLKAFARLLTRGAARASDLIARYGGEEFVVLLPETDPAGAGVVAEHLLGLLQEAAIPHAASPLAKQLSASIGVSTLHPTAASRGRRTAPLPANLPGPGDLLATADRALYEAKRCGRCRAIFLPCEIDRSAEATRRVQAETPRA